MTQALQPLEEQRRMGRLHRGPDPAAWLRPGNHNCREGRTILEGGITSTRWRDYVDIVQLAQQGIDSTELLRSARAVARYRGVILEPVTPYLSGYSQTGQAKWAAWRRKEGLEATTQQNLNAQVELGASYLEPVFIYKGVPQ